MSHIEYVLKLKSENETVLMKMFHETTFFFLLPDTISFHIDLVEE